MKEKSGQKLKIATIYSYSVNEDGVDGFVDDENSDNTDGLSSSSRDFLEMAINDYNKEFGTSYDTSSDKFPNYYKDLSLRMKNREVDLLIVVNMFLTGFDATTLNTLWVDKNLKMHGLIQAFSRTNRILNSVKTFGNILRLRNILSSFDEFSGNEILKPIDFQDYTGIYNDLYYKYRPKGEKENINDDIVFEMELVKQVEVNIDYILSLLIKYHKSNCEDKEILIAIDKAIKSSLELRSKKELIDNFINTINLQTDVEKD